MIILDNIYGGIMARRKKKNNYFFQIFAIILIAGIIYYYRNDIKEFFNSYQTYSYALDNIPEYNGKEYVTINENKPTFTDEEYITTSFEKYSKLDKLGRAGIAYANIGIELMPTEERESIGMVKPSGWHTVKYDIVSGKYLYNRCHLIGYQLTGENANEKNLITCTRSMNTEGMLKFENEVADYLKKYPNNHVLYRVTPIYKENNLLARGVQIEASSVEDKCGKVCFNVFVYNAQEGIEIDYKTGDSKLKE